MAGVLPQSGDASKSYKSSHHPVNLKRSVPTLMPNSHQLAQQRTQIMTNCSLKRWGPNLSLFQLSLMFFIGSIFDSHRQAFSVITPFPSLLMSNLKSLNWPLSTGGIFKFYTMGGTYNNSIDNPFLILPSHFINLPNGSIISKYLTCVNKDVCLCAHTQ